MSFSRTSPLNSESIVQVNFLYWILLMGLMGSPPASSTNWALSCSFPRMFSGLVINTYINHFEHISSNKQHCSNHLPRSGPRPTGVFWRWFGTVTAIPLPARTLTARRFGALPIDADGSIGVWMRIWCIASDTPRWTPIFGTKFQNSYFLDGLTHALFCKIYQSWLHLR